MSNLRRTSSVLTAAVLVVPFWANPAAAAALTEQASTGGYFSASGVPDTGTDAGKPPNVTAEADGVAPGNLAVAGGNGAEQKVSFLFFSLAELPIGGTVTKAQMTVPLVPSGNGNVVISADPVKVRACTAGPEGFGGEDGESITVAPARLCDQGQAPAKLSADGKSYVFDITPIAASWGTTNDGVALTTAEGADSTPFQVVFGPAPTATLTYEATAPAEVPTPPSVPVTDTTGGDLGGFGGGSTDLGGGFDDTSVTVPDAGGFGSVESPVVDTALPAAPEAAAPAAAAPDVAAPPQAITQVAASEVLRPGASFVVGSLLFAALLALLSLIMGDPRVPQTVSRQSRLSQALQARERADRRAGGTTPRIATV